jgi:metal-responsive CopG/Arc/MetJ family transcriptional regulator
MHTTDDATTTDRPVTPRQRLTVTLTLPRTLAAELDRMAAADRRSRSNMVEVLIEQRLAAGQQ